MSVTKRCKCGCEIKFETDGKVPRSHKCFVCGETIRISGDEGEEFEGTEGQDREAYTDEQDRENYIEEVVEVVKKRRGRPPKVKVEE